jgi:hypothetical protein
MRRELVEKAIEDIAAVHQIARATVARDRIFAEAQLNDPRLGPVAQQEYRIFHEMTTLAYFDAMTELLQRYGRTVIGTALQEFDLPGRRWWER